jgi:hypothetical protein
MSDTANTGSNLLGPPKDGNSPWNCGVRHWFQPEGYVKVLVIYSAPLNNYLRLQLLKYEALCGSGSLIYISLASREDLV